MSEGKTTTVVCCEAGGVTVGQGLWVRAAGGGWFYCNAGTWHGSFKQTTRDVAILAINQLNAQNLVL